MKPLGLIGKSLLAQHSLHHKSIHVNTSHTVKHASHYLILLSIAFPITLLHKANTLKYTVISNITNISIIVKLGLKLILALRWAHPNLTILSCLGLAWLG